MNKILFWLMTAGLFSIWSFSVYAQEWTPGDPLFTEIETTVLRPFFKALHTGNLSQIKRCLSAAALSQNEALLTQNKTYAGFLRSYYGACRFSALKATLVEGIAVFDIRIDYPNGQRGVAQLEIMRNEGKAGGEKWLVHKLSSERGKPEPVTTNTSKDSRW